MNKDIIYRIIGYHGEYSESVKKALKKLLKENHPDHHGNEKVFKLITDVKKELETNQVSFKYNKEEQVSFNEDIDYNYCKKMQMKLLKEKEKIIKEIIDKRQEFSHLANNYKKIYKNSVLKADIVLNMKNKKSINVIKIIFVIMLLVIFILFWLAIIKQNLMFFILFGILSFITILIISKYFQILNEITKESKKKINQYLQMIDQVHEVSIKQEILSKDIFNLERKLKKVENDLRFYDNLLQ